MYRVTKKNVHHKGVPVPVGKCIELSQDKAKALVNKVELASGIYMPDEKEVVKQVTKEVVKQVKDLPPAPKAKG